MRTGRAVLLCVAAAVAACGGPRDREQTGTASGQLDTTRAASPSPGPPADSTPSATPLSGQAVYQRTCNVCHQPTGRGMPNTFPPLAGSPFVTGAKSRLIRIVLHGVSGPLTVEGARFNSVMPPLKTQLSDAEIAAVLSYVRSSFGNAAGPVTKEEVQQERTATASRTTSLTAADLR